MVRLLLVFRTVELGIDTKYKAFPRYGTEGVPEVKYCTRNYAPLHKRPTVLTNDGIRYSLWQFQRVLTKLWVQPDSLGRVGWYVVDGQHNARRTATVVHSAVA